TPEILAALAIIMQADKEPEVRAAAIKTLQAFGSTIVTSESLTTLATSRQSQTTSETLAELAVKLLDKELKVQDAAIEALKTFGATAATPEILVALSNMLCYDTYRNWEQLGWKVFKVIEGLGIAAATPEI